VQALVAAGATPVFDPLAFFARAQADDGGFPFLSGLDPDPISTGLVYLALLAAGEDPGAAPWTGAGNPGPLAALLAWQLGCDAPVADRGALASPFSGGAPDDFATRQAVWALEGVPLPLRAAPFEPTPDPCDPTTTTTAPTTTTTAATPSTTSAAATPTTAPARAVATTPRYAG
jgi:hypothetical protein